MTYLLIYLAITIVGYIIGSRFKKKSISAPWIGKVMTAVILILVFIMGSRIGDNEQILGSLDSIGLISFIYTIIIMGFACLFFTIARRIFGFDRYGIRNKDGAGYEEASSEDEPSIGSDSLKSPVNILTLLIVISVILGILAGHFLLPDAFMKHAGSLLTLDLCMLLILIGMDVGVDGTIKENFKNAGWRIIAFPLVSILSMIAGSAFAAMVLPIGLQDSLCIGSGLGWYSLAPAMLADYSTRISALSFMHNVFREILGILLVPMIAKNIGYLECYSVPGCTSMDVSLPVVERSTRSDIAVYSFICGAILSASVPILVSIFMSL